MNQVPQIKRPKPRPEEDPVILDDGEQEFREQLLSRLAVLNVSGWVIIAILLVFGLAGGCGGVLLFDKLEFIERNTAPPPLKLPR